MKFHDLKSWPIPFFRVKTGIKRFEVRKNDRNFETGDIVLLREFTPTEEAEKEYRAETGICRATTLGYTGASAGPFRIGYVEKGEHVPDGYCVFELVPLVDASWEWATTRTRRAA